MALLDLKTDLKSLKYGQDQPGGGSSREPYIKVDINKVDSGFNQFRLTKFDDGLVRGGIIGATNASIVDTIRIGKFFTDFPKGPLFLIKQVGLQLTNPQLEHKNDFRTDRTVTLQGTNLDLQGTNLNTSTLSDFRNTTNNLINKTTGAITHGTSVLINKVTGTVAKGISTAATTLANLPSRIENEIGSTRIYNLGLNTLTQIPLNAVGGHVLRHGFLPIRDENRDYINVVYNNNFNVRNNRLEKYASQFGLGGFGPYPKNAGDPALGEIDSYIGGPDSTYGLIRTRIKRFGSYTNDRVIIERSLGFSRNFSGKTNENGSPKEIEFDLNRLLGASNHPESKFSISGSNNVYPLSSNNSYVPVNLRDRISSKDDNQNPFRYGIDNSYSSQVIDNNAITTIGGGAQTVSFGTPTDTQQALSQFSIFKPKYSDTINFIDAYTRSISQFNTLISKQITGLRKRATQTQQSPSSQISASAQNLSNITVTTNDYNFKPSSDIRGGNTDRTWRTKEEMQDVLDKAYSRTIESYTSFNTVSSTQGTQQQLPDRFLGASRLDPDVKNKSVDSSIYDYTVINYSDVQPALRKYSELKKQIDAQTSSSIGMSNHSKSSTSNNTVVVGNQLPSSTETVSYKNNYGEKIILSNKLPWNKISREVRIGSGRQDEINLTPIFGAGKYDGSDKVTIDGKSHNIRDLVKFRIQAVDTDGPDSGKWMVFRAYLTDLSDNVDATWNDVKYAGRGDKFFIYDGFTRKINVSFKVAALSEGESRFIYQKLNFLMSNTMPDYNNTLMRGPLTRLTVGNWVDSQLGILNSVQLKVPQDSPWEIAIDEPEGGSAANLLILPHIVEVTLTFTPIGSESKGANKLPQKSDQISNIAQNNTGADAVYLQYIGQNVFSNFRGF